jgi:DNA-binding NarL/FixJ family response regulator
LVSVLVVADVRLYREGLVQALGHRDGLEVVGAAVSDDAPSAELADLNPDVVLVDVGACDGLETVQSVVECVPDAKVVALALPESENDVIACAEAGASGYVPREGTIADVESVIQSVARGEARFPPKMTAGLLRRLADLAAGRESVADGVHLTSRETEIVELIDQGLSNKEIAQRLSIAVSTVKNHVHNILDKLHVERRSEAVARLKGAQVLDGHRGATARRAVGV